MDENITALCKRLQAAVHGLDVSKHRDTLLWMQGFLTAISLQVDGKIDMKNAALKSLETTKEKRQETKSLLDEVRKWQDDVGRKREDDEDSIERLDRELEGPDDVPVPAKRTPGPKGRSGGTALPLPDTGVQ